jgi:hypothetical protein
VRGNRTTLWSDKQYAWRDSDPRPSVPKTDALSTELQARIAVRINGITPYCKPNSGDLSRPMEVLGVRYLVLGRTNSPEVERP